MIDYSFFRFKTTLAEANNIGDSPDVDNSLRNVSCLQLLPNKTYLQITNINGGASFSSNFEAFVVDCSDNVLKDITEHVFLNEVVGVDGNTQLEIELVNINADFYRQTVFIKLRSLISDVVYYSSPMNITSYEAHRTIFLKYKSFDDFNGIPYSNTDKFQSISVNAQFDTPVDESEITTYYQITTQDEIGVRVLNKEYEKYKVEDINRFVYQRLNMVFKHDLVYLDDIRVTNKPILQSSEREGNTNFMITDFTVDKNYNDVSPYEYQIFTGLDIENFTPNGVYTLANLDNHLSVEFTTPININTGTIRIYDESNTLIVTYTDNDMYLDDVNIVAINNLTTDITTNGNYYILFDAGLFSSSTYGIEYEGISDPNTWTFTVQDADYSSTDYSSNDYLTD